VRFLVDVRRIDDDRIEGVVTPEGEHRGRAFSGWLELIHLLEPDPGDGADGATPTVVPAGVPSADGRRQ
jgi:hypothetical protein